MAAIAVVGFWPSYWGGMVVLALNASRFSWLSSDAWRDLSARMAEAVTAALLPLL